MNAAQQAEIQDIESKMAELQRQLEDLRKPKWEPKPGEFYLNSVGEVFDENSSEIYRLAGIEHQTHEAAEEHARDLKVYNWLWQFRQEHREKGEEEKHHAVFFAGEWSVGSRAFGRVPGRVDMSERVAELAVEELTEGRLVLEGFESNLPH